jgi:hypothetical protein
MVSYSYASGIRFNDCLFSEPTRIEGWNPPPFAGIYAVLAADLNWAPKAFQALFFGEFGNTTPPASFFHECAGLMKGAGERTLFVAVLPMPFSTSSQRWAVCNELVRAYHPIYQAETPLPPGNQVCADTKTPPRRRIGFMPQTETA